MSRIGKKGIVIKSGVEAKFADGLLSIKGPKGNLERRFRPDISIAINGSEIVLAPVKLNLQTKALWGTYASHVKNMLKGVTEGFEKKLVLEGVGYKAQVNGDKVVMALGFSHPVEVGVPAGLSVKAEKNVLSISGPDKELVGSFSAELRALKKPEPYKGKGFHYSDEVVRRKQGKKSV